MEVEIMRKAIVAVAVALVVGVALAWAAQQITREKGTGLFTLELQEGLDVAIVTYGMATGAGPSDTWCEADVGVTSPVRCVLEVKNLNSTLSPAFTFSVVDADNSDGLGLASAMFLVLRHAAGGSAAQRDACRAGNYSGFTAEPTTTLDGSPSFVGALGPNGVLTVCIVTGIQEGQEPFGVGTATTSATIRVVASVE
jgi:hypothetical protein